MRRPRSVVVAGAGAAGVAAAETLRREGYEGPLVLLGDEPAPPYDRPPLSKQVLTGAWEPERTDLRDADHFAGLDVRLVRGRATGLDVGRALVRVEGAPDLPYDGLVIATGLRPRRLPECRDLAGVHVLRDRSDALALRAALRDALRDGRRAVVVGAGFLGLEVAAAARGMGLEVTVADPLPVPMTRQVGPRVGAAVAALHRDRGVDLRMGAGIEEAVAEDGRVAAVRLSDGTTVRAGVVVVAVGAEPAVGWLRGSGLPLGDGVECDEHCRAAPGIYAAGDVASWLNPRYGRRMRVEHRTNATDQGAAAAHNLLHGDVKPFAPLPYFWSDQYDVKIQAHGVFPEGSDVTIEEGAVEDGRFVALYRSGGALTGVLGWNLPARVMPYRKRLLER
ncbi:NAD(P)/FAD-dependent oxidoreductase [Actinomadura sp. WAC 06369]|uniref:NAD(P)/FAD-dependent oxidoreductase n=1 Tax=Actinomadura sp. WAC 06369 TaxID=2203193 RepID=UPI000F782931|nr:FAD-dependent oxidoreductase [Actinomadura sp. WAC 06369]RSN63944.1 FAD-dependent oxidoreductase [Actinomadura sp. WAC 06369]